ncbi:MAG: adenylyl-sulfate kinase, partial [Deltaproteobacteria bacterium]|nr:adenylyl-sulfate kinase [Deltaproteobacteria bacterium]
MLQSNGFTLWLTGMAGSGKSTLANYLGIRFKTVGRKAEVLDHDEVGPVLTKELGTSKEERLVQMARLGFLAKLLTRNDCIVIAAAISPHREARDKIRKEIGRFVEVFVDCPTETLIERDTKGLYKKALAGELPNFTGVTEPYDTPQHAEVTVHTDVETVEMAAERVVQTLVNIGYLKPDEAKSMVGKRLRPIVVAKGKAGKPAKGGKDAKVAGKDAKAGKPGKAAARSAGHAKPPASAHKARLAKRE